MKILIVDDEPHLRTLIQQTLEELEDEGVDLITATNGEEALETIREEEPNLVFLDVMMPKKNGFGSIAIQRGLEYELDGKVDVAYRPSGLVVTLEIPVAALTADSNGAGNAG